MSSISAVITRAGPVTRDISPRAILRDKGIDLQKWSIASLTISRGLIVDEPVVAGDAIKGGVVEGKPRVTAAWVGPTKLAHAIMYATITNIAAYLPLRMISGEIGQFIFSL